MEGREYPLFATGIGLAILHVLDDAFVGKQPGTSARDHLFGASVVIAILVGALILYPRLRAGWRAALAVGLGTLITGAGAMHVAHTIIDAPERSDFTGILAAAGGVLLIVLGVVVAWRSPAHPVRSRRWLQRGLVAIGVLAVGFYVIFPIGAAVYVTHTPREPIDGAFSVPHEDVSFETGDGLTIRGWYAPSRNGAAIVLVHGSGAAAWAPARTRSSWRDTATACCSTTPGDAARATATRTASTGRGSRTSMLRSTS